MKAKPFKSPEMDKNQVISLKKLQMDVKNDQADEQAVKTYS